LFCVVVRIQIFLGSKREWIYPSGNFNKVSAHASPAITTDISSLTSEEVNQWAM